MYAKRHFQETVFILNKSNPIYPSYPNPLSRILILLSNLRLSDQAAPYVLFDCFLQLDIPAACYMFQPSLSPSCLNSINTKDLRQHIPSRFLDFRRNFSKNLWPRNPHVTHPLYMPSPLQSHQFIYIENSPVHSYHFNGGTQRNTMPLMADAIPYGIDCNKHMEETDPHNLPPLSQK
jgi:hypothetical protein